ncbi:hypothetical protein [Nereida sp. MMG025]|uniref:hypothetical protein n=1 Tax=Nereida sp. MMG025 TaxID=2909981 RepID=UPI001F2CA508|nr:hypothetical protein [Nereida sp. MMG025]MCF6444325.1 hypothetical protein [Nereida sp. MMG025]
MKSVLTHTVKELGLQLTIDDSNTDFSIIENQAMLLETATLMRIQVKIVEQGRNATATFFQ